MKTIKWIFKGVLLYVTILSVMLFILAIDGLPFQAAIYWLLINIALIIECSIVLSYRDLYTLSLQKYIEQHFK